jgi:hypothetical protein
MYDNILTNIILTKQPLCGQHLKVSIPISCALQTKPTKFVGRHGIKDDTQDTYGHSFFLGMIYNGVTFLMFLSMFKE